MTDLAKQEGIAARALEFTILTAARTGEALGATWSEIDLDAATWTVPASRMKIQREHAVPLSPAAVKIVEAMKALRQSDYVFPGAKPKRPLSNMALLMTLRRMGRGDLTAHGFRSTFRDWCAETTNFPREVAEMALAHAIPSAVEAAYGRGEMFERRRGLMREWALFCSKPTAAGKVIPINQARAG
jgi:integrase